MADGYDRYDNEGGGGGSFVMGLLTGTVLGAGLGMLFAPKAGSELRGQLSEQANNLANSASEGYRRASEAATGWAEKGREAYDKAAEKGRDVYDKAKDAVAKGADEAQRYAREATSGSPSPASGTSGFNTGSGYGGSDQTRGQGSDFSGPGGSRRS
jgi:gas vesicle protein